ncbi:MAG: hypothetical protein JWR77_1620, partial [Rhizorhabdus sp.]|nr:hypothetical protein [Rhizorhabdus sp.]
MRPVLDDPVQVVVEGGAIGLATQVVGINELAGEGAMPAAILVMGAIGSARTL